MKKTKNYAMPYPEQDDYFNVEDFQDMMVSVDDLMKKLSDSGAQISSDAEHLYNQTKAQMDNIQKRMNTFTSLKDGSTTGDAELEDIRVAYDGKEYGNAGEAVREQASDIHKALFGAGASIWSKAKSESTKYVAETKGICILNERFTAAGVVTKISRGTFAENESTLNLDRECSAYIVEFEKNPGTVYMPSAETIKIVSTTKIIFEANGNARCWIPVEKGQYLAVDSTATAYTSESNHVPYMLYDQANKTLECRGFGSAGSIEPVAPYSLALEYKLEYDMDDTGLVKQINANREDIDNMEVMSNSIEFNVKNINFINGHVLKDTGKTESSNKFYTTNFIPTSLVEKLIISMDEPVIVRLAQYDASKNFIDGTYINTSNTTKFINVVFSDSTRYMKICVGSWTDLKPIEYYKSIISIVGDMVLGEIRKIPKYKKAQYVKTNIAYNYLPLKINTGVDVPNGTFVKINIKASTFFEYYNDMASISVSPNLLFMVSANSDGYGSEATTVAHWRSEDFELADFSYKYIFLQVKKQDGSEITFADIANSVQIKRYTSIDDYVGKSEHIISANNIKNAPVVSKLVDESYAHESNFVIINGMCYMHYMYNTWDKWSDMNIHPETQGYIGVRLSVFSIAEPNKRTVYNIVRGGDDFLGETVVETDFCGSGTITKIGTVVRILTNITLSNSGRTCVFFDFDSNTNSVTKKGICNVRIKGADDFVPMTTQNGKQHAKWLYDNGYIDTEYRSLFFEFGSDIREYSDNGTKYVTTAMAEGTNVRSCVLLTSENCINWTALGILDTQTASGIRLNVMEAGAFRYGAQFYLIGRNNVNIATNSKDVPYFWKIEDSNLYKSTKPVCLDGDVDCSGAKPSVIRLMSRNNLLLLANISAYDKNEFSLTSGISRVAIEFYKLNFDKDTMKAKRILRVSMREGIHTPCLYEYEGNVYMSYTSQKRLLHFMDGDIRFCKLDEELFH